MNQDINDIFLAKWLSGELSRKELNEFEKSSDYSDYKQIIDTMDRAELPAYDEQKNLKAVFDKINSKKSERSKKPSKIIPLIKPLSYAVAASVLLIFGYFYLFNTASYQTLSRQSMEVVLPDNSKVELMENSSLEYEKLFWTQNRELEFKGKALFEVNSGSGFIVKTSKGNVQVLGTSFSVSTQDKHFEVICFSGKVKVESKNGESAVLTKGRKFIEKPNKKIEISQVNTTRNAWKNKVSEFNKTDILIVINELEKHYPFVIKGKEKLNPAEFTGRFPHDNSFIALKMVFESMKIPYKKQGDTIRILNY